MVGKDVVCEHGFYASVKIPCDMCGKVYLRCIKEVDFENMR